MENSLAHNDPLDSDLQENTLAHNGPRDSDLAESTLAHSGPLDNELDGDSLAQGGPGDGDLEVKRWLAIEALVTGGPGWLQATGATRVSFLRLTQRTWNSPH
jgi:hypothetical protein